MKQRFLIFLYLLDCLILAVVTLGNCKIGETLSSVAWVLEQDNKVLGRALRPLIDFLMRLPDGPDHCKRAQDTYLKITGALK